MKRFWLILLSLGLVVTFGISAMAVDVKFSGEYYVAGMYQDRTTFKKDTMSDGPSTAFYFQRLRLRTDLVVTPGLTLTTRADIMERAWGAARSTPGTTLDTQSSGTRAENENIVFDFMYLTYLSPIGVFKAGYMASGEWGTAFNDSSTPWATLVYALPIGKYLFGVQVAKNNDNSFTAINAADASDRDKDQYYAYVKYYFKNGSAGFIVTYLRQATSRAYVSQQTGFMTTGFGLSPYVIAKLGPVSMQAEFAYAWGQYMKWEGSSPYDTLGDTRLENIGILLDATADLGKIYVGGTFAYVSGDDPGTGQNEGSAFLTGGLNWNPCLMMFNAERNYWAGTISGYAGSLGAPMTNAWFFQGRAGVKPIDKLDIMASVSYANADKKPTSNWQNNDYGWEVDLIATYKITNNLSYMLGGAYLFTGKYFKGEGSLTSPNDLANDYMIINKLNLTF